MKEKCSSKEKVKDSKSNTERKDENPYTPKYSNELSIFQRETLHKIDEFRAARSKWLTSYTNKAVITDINEDLHKTPIHKDRWFWFRRIGFKTTFLRNHRKTFRPVKFYTLKRKLLGPNANTSLAASQESLLIKNKPKRKCRKHYEIDLREEKQHAKKNELKVRKKHEYEKRKRYREKVRDVQEKKETLKPSQKAIEKLKAAKIESEGPGSHICNHGKDLTVVIKGVCPNAKKSFYNSKLIKACEELSKLKNKNQESQETLSCQEKDSLEISKEKICSECKTGIKEVCDVCSELANKDKKYEEKSPSQSKDSLITCKQIIEKPKICPDSKNDLEIKKSCDTCSEPMDDHVGAKDKLSQPKDSLDIYKKKSKIENNCPDSMSMSDIEIKDFSEECFELEGENSKSEGRLSRQPKDSLIVYKKKTQRKRICPVCGGNVKVKKFCDKCTNAEGRKTKSEGKLKCQPKDSLLKYKKKKICPECKSGVGSKESCEKCAIVKDTKTKSEGKLTCQPKDSLIIYKRKAEEKRTSPECKKDIGIKDSCEQFASTDSSKTKSERNLSCQSIDSLMAFENGMKEEKVLLEGKKDIGIKHSSEECASSEGSKTTKSEKKLPSQSSESLMFFENEKKEEKMRPVCKKDLETKHPSEECANSESSKTKSEGNLSCQSIDSLIVFENGMKKEKMCPECKSGISIIESCEVCAIAEGTKTKSEKKLPSQSADSLMVFENEMEGQKMCPECKNDIGILEYCEECACTEDTKKKSTKKGKKSCPDCKNGIGVLEFCKECAITEGTITKSDKKLPSQSADSLLVFENKMEGQKCPECENGISVKEFCEECACAEDTKKKSTKKGKKSCPECKSGVGILEYCEECASTKDRKNKSTAKEKKSCPECKKGIGIVESCDECAFADKTKMKSEKKVPCQPKDSLIIYKKKDEEEEICPECKKDIGIKDSCEECAHIEGNKTESEGKLSCQSTDSLVVYENVTEEKMCLECKSDISILESCEVCAIAEASKTKSEENVSCQSTDSLMVYENTVEIEKICLECKNGIGIVESCEECAIAEGTKTMSEKKQPRQLKDSLIIYKKKAKEKKICPKDKKGIGVKKSCEECASAKCSATKSEENLSCLSKDSLVVTEGEKICPECKDSIDINESCSKGAKSEGKKKTPKRKEKKICLECKSGICFIESCEECASAEGRKTKSEGKLLCQSTDSLVVHKNVTESISHCKSDMEIKEFCDECSKVAGRNTKSEGKLPCLLKNLLDIHKKMVIEKKKICSSKTELKKESLNDVCCDGCKLSVAESEKGLCQSNDSFTIQKEKEEMNKVCKNGLEFKESSVSQDKNRESDDKLPYLLKNLLDIHKKVQKTVGKKFSFINKTDKSKRENEDTCCECSKLSLKSTESEGELCQSTHSMTLNKKLIEERETSSDVNEAKKVCHECSKFSDENIRHEEKLLCQSSDSFITHKKQINRKKNCSTSENDLKTGKFCNTCEKCSKYLECEGTVLCPLKDSSDIERKNLEEKKLCSNSECDFNRCKLKKACEECFKLADKEIESEEKFLCSLSGSSEKTYKKQTRRNKERQGKDKNHQPGLKSNNNMTLRGDIKKKKV